jgi:hypothetical protein
MVEADWADAGPFTSFLHPRHRQVTSCLWAAASVRQTTATEPEIEVNEKKEKE